MALKILAWDIECAPAVVHSWGLHNQFHSINQVMEDPYIMSFAAQWVGSKKIEFRSTYHDGRKEMLARMWTLMDEADALLSWNGKGFDTKWAYGEFIREGMSPPSPVKEIDLMQAVRSSARFLSTKLDYVAQALGIGKKKSTGGHELWVACMNDDPKAWAKMKSYNRQDVALLIELYYKLLPWIANHPNMNLYYEGDGCPACHSDNFQKRGYHYTGVSKTQRYRCMNENCGRWFHDRKVIERAAFSQA